MQRNYFVLRCCLYVFLPFLSRFETFYVKIVAYRCRPYSFNSWAVQLKSAFDETLFCCLFLYSFVLLSSALLPNKFSMEDFASRGTIPIVDSKVRRPEMKGDEMIGTTVTEQNRTEQKMRAQYRTAIL